MTLKHKAELNELMEKFIEQVTGQYQAYWPDNIARIMTNAATAVFDAAIEASKEANEQIG